jgi:FKBP-type peptidyl-prolyl cis-trans isomerase (trigger factor)
MSHKHSYKATVKKLPETGEVEIKSSISIDEFAEAVVETLDEIRKDITLPGFRKGSAPAKIVREKVGEMALLRDAAEHAISHAYSHILETEKIDAIGYPKVNITKIAEGNPLEFTITTAVVPEIGKFDYKKIAKAENAKKIDVGLVTDEEIDKNIENIKKNFGAAMGAGKSEEEKAKPIELTDDIVKTWGEFKDVADFKAKLKENLKVEKEHKAKEKKRLELVDALTKDLDVVIPEILVESELGRMSNQMRHDIERMGMKFDDYLHLKKTEADIKKEWRTDAVKRVKLDLVINHIAKEEKIEADSKKVEAEVKHATEHHKDVDPERARSYFGEIFKNQAVFEFLEGIK